MPGSSQAVRHCAILTRLSSAPELAHQLTEQQHSRRHGEKFFHGVFSFCCVLIFSAQPNFYSIRKVIPLYKNQPSVRYFSINAQNKQDGSCFFAMICNHFGGSALFCLRWHACAQALSGQLLPFCRCAVPAAKAAKEKRAAARFVQQPVGRFYCFASCLSSHAAISAKTSSLLVSSSSSWRAPG